MEHQCSSDECSLYSFGNLKLCEVPIHQGVSSHILSHTYQKITPSVPCVISQSECKFMVLIFKHPNLTYSRSFPFAFLHHDFDHLPKNYCGNQHAHIIYPFLIHSHIFVGTQCNTQERASAYMSWSVTTQISCDME